MKKLLIFILAIFITLPISSQNYKGDGKPYAFYCQLLGKENLAGQLRLTILWDNQEEENHLRDDDGKKIEFRTMVDAMNYMSKRGWDYVECIYYENVCHYIFRKFVTSDEEAKEGLHFKSDLRK